MKTTKQMQMMWETNRGTRKSMDSSRVVPSLGLQGHEIVLMAVLQCIDIDFQERWTMTMGKEVVLHPEVCLKKIPGREGEDQPM